MLTQLRTSIAKGEAVLVVGAGVTANATGGHEAGTWRGLIMQGLTHVAETAGKGAEWLEHQKWLLGGDIYDLIGVAQQVETRLKRAGGFDRWIQESIGSMVATQPDIYNSLSKSRAPILTTNYDTLIEQATGKGSRSWDGRFNLGEWLHRSPQRREVLHLHGIYNDSDSVVLGNTSYQSLLLNDQAQFVQKVLAATSDLVFLGCGSTTEDPNLGALLDWVAHDRSGRQHYRLCLNAEVVPIMDAAAGGSKIAPISYGSTYDDLPGFIEQYLVHPEETLTQDMRDLAIEYIGTPDGAPQDPQRWWAKDAVFTRMRTATAASRSDLDGLRFLPSDGFKALALAWMLNRPCETHDLSIDRMCDERLPVNAAFKACDYVGERVSKGGAQRAPAVLKSILNKVDRMWPHQDDLQKWLADKRAELAAALKAPSVDTSNIAAPATTGPA